MLDGADHEQDQPHFVRSAKSELELTEAELDHVVGGSPAAKTSAKGSDQQVYMTITMTDVFIASYR